MMDQKFYASSNIEELSLSFDWNHVVEKFQERVASIGEIRIANPKQYSVEIVISYFERFDAESKRSQLKYWESGLALYP